MRHHPLRDLDTAWEAVRLAKRPRVHTFLATSAIHMEHKLKMTPDQASPFAQADIRDREI